MSAASAATASAEPPEPTSAGAEQRAVPAHARQLAAQLSTLFEHDTAIVQRLNDAHHRLHDANQRLYSGLAPDAFGLIYNGAAATATGTSQIAALIRNGGPTTNSAMLEALQQIHWQIHRAFCAYQHAAEQRRELAVGRRASQQLTRALCTAGWSATRRGTPTCTSSPGPIADRRSTRIVATTPLGSQPEPLHAATLSRSSKRSRTPALHR